MCVVCKQWHDNLDNEMNRFCKLTCHSKFKTMDPSFHDIDWEKRISTDIIRAGKLYIDGDIHEVFEFPNFKTTEEKLALVQATTKYLQSAVCDLILDRQRRQEYEEEAKAKEHHADDEDDDDDGDNDSEVSPSVSSTAAAAAASAAALSRDSIEALSKKIVRQTLISLCQDFVNDPYFMILKEVFNEYDIQPTDLGLITGSDAIFLEHLKSARITKKTDSAAGAASPSSVADSYESASDFGLFYIQYFYDHFVVIHLNFDF